MKNNKAFNFIFFFTYLLKLNIIKIVTKKEFSLLILTKNITLILNTSFKYFFHSNIMKKITIIQSSLRQGSNTAIMCEALKNKAASEWVEVNYLDLRELELEFCDGRNLEDYNLDLQSAYKSMEDSQAIIFWMPVYQYSMSWVLKNFIDICWGAVAGKKIWAIVNAGWPNCYMASRDLLDALYYEYGTTNIAPTPYSWSMDFKDWKIVNNKVSEKIDELVSVLK